jgi:hypothetical protein
VTNQSIQPASRGAGRGLVNLLLLDSVETEIYLGGAEVVGRLVDVPFIRLCNGWVGRGEGDGRDW